MDIQSPDQSHDIQSLKLVTFYETAKRCVLMIDYLYSELEESTKLASSITATEVDHDLTVKLHTLSLGLIDFYHRFDQIIQQIPMLSKINYMVKQLHNTTECVRNCRNYLQHIRNELSTKDPITFPILGSISWVHDNLNFIIISEQANIKFGAPGIAYDTVGQKFVCRYQLTVGGFEVRLDDIYLAIKSFWDWFDSVFYINNNDIKKYSWGTRFLIHVDFSHVQPKV